MSAHGQEKEHLRGARQTRTKHLEPRAAEHESTGVETTSRSACSELAYERIQHLYEVSTLLTRFDDIERTIPAAIAVVARTLPLCSSIFLLETDSPGKPRTVIWQLETQSALGLRTAKAHAEYLYRYFVPSGVDLESDVSGADLEHANKTESKTTYIFLPLVVGKRPIFGALHLAGIEPINEPDLVFVNAVVNQVAIAVDRQSLVDAKQRVTEKARANAETSRATAEAGRAEAEVKQAAAEEAAEIIRREFAFARGVTASLGEGVVAVDLEGRITLFNSCAEQLLGWRAEEALGMRVEEVVQILRADGALITAEQRPFEVVMRGGTVVRNDDGLFSSRGRDAFPVSYTCAPLRPTGRVTGAVLAFRDIMDVKRAEKEQRVLADVSAILASSLEPRDTLSSVVRFVVPLLADLCFIDEIGEDGKTRRLAVAFADEKNQRELAGRVMRFSPSLGWKTPQSKVLESGKSLACEIDDPAVVAHDSEHAEVIRATRMRSMMVVPLLARGRTLGALTFVAGESGRRYGPGDLHLAEEIGRRAALAIDNARLYTSAQRATRAREDLLAIVSHDLKTPLSVILMTVGEMLGSSGPDDRRESKTQLARIKRSTDRMIRLIQDLLDTASIEAGHLSLESQHVQVAPLVSDALEAVFPIATSKQIQLKSEIGEDLPPVDGDVVRLQQILANLLGNALKFTPEGGAITLRAVRSSDSVTLSVMDTGPGIPQRDLVHLFDRFWQAKRTARYGTGLGLYIVKGIAESHGGSVWVESTVGVGSTFFVKLPIA